MRDYLKAVGFVALLLITLIGWVPLGIGVGVTFGAGFGALSIFLYVILMVPLTVKYTDS